MPERDDEDAKAYDDAMGELDRAELLDPPPARKRPPRRHAALCYDDEGQLDCQCYGGVQWADHPSWGNH